MIPGQSEDTTALHEQTPTSLEQAHASSEQETAPSLPEVEPNEPSETLPLRNGSHKADQEAVTKDNNDEKQGPETSSTNQIETTTRLEAMARERDDLRQEVSKLRRSLEAIEEKHQEELSGLRDEIEDAQSAKEDAETQYHTLLGKVNTIRSQLGERLKADAVRQCYRHAVNIPC